MGSSVLALRTFRQECTQVPMSAVEMAVEKVRQLDEQQARRLLVWLQVQERSAGATQRAGGAKAMLGFARKFHSGAKSTADWLHELREGDLA